MSFVLAPYLVSGSISLYLGYKTYQSYYNQPFEYLELEAQEIEELGNLQEINENIIDDIKEEEVKEDIKEDVVKEDIKEQVVDKVSDNIVSNVLEKVNLEKQEDKVEKVNNKEMPISINKKVELLKQKNLDKYDEKHPNKLDIGLISIENFDGRKVLPPIGTRPKVGLLPPIGETQELDFVELKPTVYIPKKNNKKNKRKNKNRN